jgi:hypothetical protein
MSQVGQNRLQEHGFTSAWAAAPRNRRLGMSASLMAVRESLLYDSISRQVPGEVADDSQHGAGERGLSPMGVA